MRKDNIRDYATAAFREYARLGSPSSVEHLERDNAALAADLRAVKETLRILDAEGNRYIADAVRAVYFAAPSSPLLKGEISARVAAFAKEYPTCERCVYRWLKRARGLFARLRGLRIK